MTPFTLHALLPSTPQCPLCRSDLIPHSITFYDSIAYCHNCLPFAQRTTHTCLLSALHNPLLSAHFYTVQGLRFFCPQVGIPGNLAAHCLYNPKPQSTASSESQA